MALRIAEPCLPFFGNLGVLENSAFGSRFDVVELRNERRKCSVRWLPRSRVGDEASRKSDRAKCVARAGLGEIKQRGIRGDALVFHSPTAAKPPIR